MMINKNKSWISKVSLRKAKKYINKNGEEIEYKNAYIYLPSNLVGDSSFPFTETQKVNIEVKEGKLVISKINYLVELIQNYGIENLTLPKLLEDKARENNDKPLVLFHDEIYSYADVNRVSNKLSNGLLQIGKKLGLKQKKTLKRTSKIAVMLPNCPDFLFCWFAIVKSGYLFVPINRFVRSDQLKYVIEQSEAEIFILEHEYLKIFEEVKEDLSQIEAIIIRNAPPDFVFNEYYLDYEEVMTDNETSPKVQSSFLDPIEIIFTEGTTGMPKSIVYRNVLVLAGLIFSEEMKKHGKGKVIYCPTPLFQAFSQLVIALSALFYNATIALAERFNAKTYWEDVKHYQADLVAYYGGILQSLIDEPPSKLDRTHGAKFAVGGEAPKELWEAFENRFGLTLYEGWAPSEAIGFTLNSLGTKGGKVGSIGTNINGFDIKIVDNNGNELGSGPDNIGEIIVKMDIPFGGLPSSVNLLEYYKNPENTAMKTGEKGYVYTGDMAFKDRDGYLYYVGRKVDVIKRHGKDVYAHTIENITNAHPSILESAVFGVPGDEANNDEIKICVVLKKDQKLNHKQLHYYLSENLAYFIVPRYIEFKEKLRSSSERIKKYILKKEWDNLETQKKTWDAQLREFVK